MVCILFTACFPLAVSRDNMTQSAPSKMALATSATSARVGRGLNIMLPNIWKQKKQNSDPAIHLTFLSVKEQDKHITYNGSESHLKHANCHMQWRRCESNTDELNTIQNPDP